MIGDNFAMPSNEDVATMLCQYADRISANPHDADTAMQARWVMLVASRLIRRLGDRTIALARTVERLEVQL